MNKSAVRDGFSGCYTTYCSEAVAQQQIALTLATLACKHQAGTPVVGVEVGCGSGFLTQQLLAAYPSARWLFNDISDASGDYVRRLAHSCGAADTRFAAGDAETMEYPDGIDLFASASAVQWFCDLAAFLRRLASSMSSSGVIAISTFGPDNLHQIRELTGSGLSYLTAGQVAAASEPCFEVFELVEQHIELHFKEPVEVLRHLKLTGVNGAFRRTWTKGMLASFCNGYEAFRSDKGYPLTYHPVYLVGRKR